MWNISIMKATFLNTAETERLGIGSDGTALWNGSYEMANPMVDVCGTYVAVADQGGKEVYVYNGSDDGTVLEMPLPVTMIKVASQGVVAVVLEDSGSNVVSLYNPYSSDEKLLVEVPSNVSEDGYPIDIALSADAKSLVTVISFHKGRSAGKQYMFL